MEGRPASSPIPQYRRLIVQFSHAPVRAEAMRIAAEFAKLLGLEFQAMFVEDEAVLNLAAFPFGREIRMPTREWQSLDRERIESDYRHAAEAARRQIRNTVGIEGVVDVMRGSLSTCLTAMWRPGDIVAIVGSALDRTGPLRAVIDVLEATTGSNAQLGILLIPPHAGSSEGPVVVVLASLNDPSLEIGAKIAAAQGAPFVVLVLEGSEGVRQKVFRVAESAGIAAERVFLVPMLRANVDLSSRLGALQERIIVVNRGAADLIGTIAAERQVPVLLVT